MNKGFFNLKIIFIVLIIFHFFVLNLFAQEIDNNDDAPIINPKKQKTNIEFENGLSEKLKQRSKLNETKRNVIGRDEIEPISQTNSYMEPGARYGLFNLRRVGGPKFFGLYPSITMQSPTLFIRSTFGSSTMVPENPLPVFLSLEAKAPYYQMGTYWGFTFHARTYEFDFSRQNVETIQLSSPTQESENRPSGAGYSTKDLGTRMRGRYDHAFPAIYFGKEGEDKMKLGIGVGPSRVNVYGTTNFYRSSNPIILRAQGLDREGFLKEFSYSQLIFGSDLSLDPLRSYFLANLAEGNNLELLGVYLAGKGDASIPNFNIITILQIQYLIESRNFTPLEVFSLLALNNGNYSRRMHSNATWVSFLEVPFTEFTFKLQVTSPIYYSNFDSFRFSFIDVSLQFPIEF